MLPKIQEWGLLLFLIATLSVSISYCIIVFRAVRQLTYLSPLPLSQGKQLEEHLPQISVIVPAYNEADNIAACVRSVLASTCLAETCMEFWVVDDQSTDQTWQILQMLQQELADPRLNILQGKARPSTETWGGKNWACFQAAQKVQGEWLLFLDADLRLKRGAIATVTQTAIHHQLHFLTCIPEIVSGSLVEWLVQPLMFTNLMVAFNSEVVKNPGSPVNFALGPFLLFHRSTYEAIGGHASVADRVAEDVAFARSIKQQGYRFQQVLAPDLAELRMYRSWASLWEGWTKVLYVGSNRSLYAMLLLLVVMLSVYTVPWLALLLSFLWLGGGSLWVGAIALLISLVGIGLQYQIRATSSPALGTTTTFWWLQGMGGALIAAMAIASVIKTWTGWGWTWRGRSLKTLH
jgi:hypothetical protein